MSSMRFILPSSGESVKNRFEKVLRTGTDIFSVDLSRLSAFTTFRGCLSFCTVASVYQTPSSCQAISPSLR